ncbi:glyoxalase [Amycolatopsis coloradensis]|uniref:Glyoxalase n=1 Tax=Amycolatopsis coloradensis TaxID=76021 RepID=A0A1R0L1K1_9PSEU|nr:VOC family protein [Amycolatopsis coloradensis]OLZ55677.1 glyoxalase [Amycolatopsis coloradensis]
MLRGLTTTTFYADDLAAAIDWYADLFGIEPYFVRDGHDEKPAYAEFRIGDYQHEFGLVRGDYRPTPAQPGPGGAIANWAVDNVEEVFAKLLEKGAKEYEPITTRGPGFVTAAVVDPFGNVLGVMVNQHYLDVLAGRK